jgi:hypothetical protein
MTEVFPNVTVVPGPRRLDQVLENESQFVRVAGDLGQAATRPDFHPAPEPGKSWWQDPKAFSPADGQGSDGEPLTGAEFMGDKAEKTGLYALEHADIFNLLYIPPYKAVDPEVDLDVLAEAVEYCKKRRAVLLVDPPPGWTDKNQAKNEFPTVYPGSHWDNAAIYFRFRMPNPCATIRSKRLGPAAPSPGYFPHRPTRGV